MAQFKGVVVITVDFILSSSSELIIIFDGAFAGMGL